MAQQGRQVFEFGPFRFGKGERLLRRGEIVVPIPPKATALLMVLLERSGEFVAKEELLSAVWPATRVADNSRTQSVSLRRKALGETAEQPYIVTGPRRGYRFVAPVKSGSQSGTGPRSLAVLP